MIARFKYFKKILEDQNQADILISNKTFTFINKYILSIGHLKILHDSYNFKKILGDQNQTDIF